MWRIERIGWSAMAAILTAALAGVFGHGPVSRATSHVGDPSQGDDYSITNGAHVVLTLVGLNVLLSQRETMVGGD
jgi:hypothetical protein